MVTYGFARGTGGLDSASLVVRFDEGSGALLSASGARVATHRHPFPSSFPPPTSASHHHSPRLRTLSQKWRSRVPLAVHPSGVLEIGDLEAYAVRTHDVAFILRVQPLAPVLRNAHRHSLLPPHLHPRCAQTASPSCCARCRRASTAPTTRASLSSTRRRPARVWVRQRASAPPPASASSAARHPHASHRRRARCPRARCGRRQPLRRRCRPPSHFPSHRSVW